MNSNKKLKNKTTTLKSVLLQTLLFILAVNFMTAIFKGADRDINFSILSTISSLIGMGISITIVYYFLNNKSFDSIDQTKGDILILFTLPLFLSISLGFYFALDFIVNLF